MNAVKEYQAILDYWFGKSTSMIETLETQSSLWWAKDVNIDKEIADLFGDSLNRLMTGELNVWKRQPKSYLAMVILSDQFSRNSYRNSAKAFAHDEFALALTLEGIDIGIDLKLNLIQRVFFYLPLEHSESMTMQDRSVALQSQLVESLADNVKHKFQGFLNYAIAHREVIEKYGRYPHRNALLGRQSRPEEIDYLNQPGSGF